MAVTKKADPAIPNVFVRSGMFSVKSFRNIDRPMVNLDIFTNDKARYVIKFDGYELNQADYQIFASLLRQQRLSGLSYGSQISIPVLNICNDLAWMKSGQNYEIIWETMSRLRRANVVIKSGKNFYDGSLILELDRDANKHVNYKLSSRISELFDDDCTYVNLSVIVGLKSMMSKWLYSYYQSHSMHIPMQLEKIRQMMRVPERMATKEFNRNFRDALREVSELKTGPFVGWKIEQDILTVYKTNEKKEVSHMNFTEFPDPFETQ